MPWLTFWYELASTYSYLAAMRVEAAATGVEAACEPEIRECLRTAPEPKHSASPAHRHSFVTREGELFWRDDRLELALPHARQNS